MLRSDDSGIRTGGAERLVFGQVAIEVLSQYLAPPHALSAQLAAEVLRSPMPNLQSAQLAGEVLRSDDSGMRQFASRIVLSQLAIEVLHVIEPIHACNCEIIPKNAPALRMLHRSYVDRVMHRLAKFNKGTR